MLLTLVKHRPGRLGNWKKWGNTNLCKESFVNKCIRRNLMQERLLMMIFHHSKKAIPWGLTSTHKNKTLLTMISWKIECRLNLNHFNRCRIEIRQIWGMALIRIWETWNNTTFRMLVIPKINQWSNWQAIGKAKSPFHFYDKI